MQKHRNTVYHGSLRTLPSSNRLSVEYEVNVQKKHIHMKENMIWNKQIVRGKHAIQLKLLELSGQILVCNGIQFQWNIVKKTNEHISLHTYIYTRNLVRMYVCVYIYILCIIIQKKNQVEMDIPVAEQKRWPFPSDRSWCVAGIWGWVTYLSKEVVFLAGGSVSMFKLYIIGLSW